MFHTPCQFRTNSAAVYGDGFHTVAPPLPILLLFVNGEVRVWLPRWALTFWVIDFFYLFLQESFHDLVSPLTDAAQSPQAGAGKIAVKRGPAGDM